MDRRDGTERGKYAATASHAVQQASKLLPLMQLPLRITPLTWAQLVLQDQAGKALRHIEQVLGGGLAGGGGIGGRRAAAGRQAQQHGRRYSIARGCHHMRLHAAAESQARVWGWSSLVCSRGCRGWPENLPSIYADRWQVFMTPRNKNGGAWAPARKQAAPWAAPCCC